MTGVEFRILGSLEVVSGGDPLPLGGPQQRALLALLVLHANEPVNRDRLIDEIWGDSPPRTAPISLNGYVSKLRKVLSNGSGAVVETRPAGYALVVEPEQLDVNQFERLVAKAREARTNGRPEDAHTMLTAALELWRGPPLGDLTFAPFAQAEIARLEERRLVALEERIDADLALGRHDDLVGELETLVDRHPLRERLRAQLMLALYRSGRQAEALHVFRETREALIENLGIEPGVPLQHLERGILNHDPSLEPPPGPERTDRTRDSRRQRLILTVALLTTLLIAGSVTAAVWSHSRSSQSASAMPPHSLVEIDPRTDALTRIPMDWTPSALGLDANTVWAIDRDSQILAGVDLRTNRPQLVGLGVTPTSVSVGKDGAVWLLSSEQGVVLQIEPQTGTRRSKNHLPLVPASSTSAGDPTGIAAGAHAIWVEDGSALTRIDPATHRVRRRLVLGGEITGIAVGLGSVWMTRGTPATLLRIDPRTMEITRIPIAQRRGPTQPFPIGLAIGSDAVWVLNGNTGTVTRIDPRLDAVATTGPRVSLNATRIAAGAGAVWVADAAGNAVLRVDPATNRVVRAIPVGGTPKALVLDKSRVWVAVDST